MMEKLFYIVSCKHTSIGDTALTLWCYSKGAYTWNRDRAGVYTQSDIKLLCDGYDNIAINKEDADRMFLPGNYFGDRYISLPNNITVRTLLSIPTKAMKSKRSAACHIQFHLPEKV